MRARGQRIDAAVRHVKQLDRMHDRKRLSQFPELRTQLDHTADVAGGDKIGARGQHIAGLA